VRTVVDTNVFSALFSGDPCSAPEARIALEAAAGRGQIAVSPAVYAELAAGRSHDVVDEFFSAKGIEVDWQLGARVWREAGTRYGRYARDRRRQRGDAGPRRILADFLIGAHALQAADALLTSDLRIFASYFPELRIVSPADEPPKHEVQDGSDHNGFVQQGPGRVGS
jgi:predicted nucleic acid-binding protein